jgi:hypothetical protein
MTRLLKLASMVLASAVFAQVEIPYVHENGDVIDADEINKNFDTVAKAAPPQDCSTNQVIKWNGSAWVCASRAIVENDCGRDTLICEALCAEGKTVVSGDCYVSAQNENELGTIVTYASIPMSDALGWKCAAESLGSSSYISAYAICQ